MNVLLIRVLIPEDVQVFHLTDVSSDILVALESLHGVVQNNDDLTETQELAMQILDPYFCSTGEDLETPPKWTPMSREQWIKEMKTSSAIKEIDAVLIHEVAL